MCHIEGVSVSTMGVVPPVCWWQLVFILLVCGTAAARNYLSFICRLVINVLCNSRQQPGVSEEIHGKEAEEESIVGRHGRSPAAQTRLKTLS